MILKLDNGKDSVIERINAYYEADDLNQCLKSCWYLFDKFAPSAADKNAALIRIAKVYVKMDEADAAIEILKRVLVSDGRNLEAYGMMLKMYSDPFSEESYKYYEHDAMSVIAALNDDAPREVREYAVELADMIMDAYVDYNVYFQKNSINLIDPEEMLGEYVKDIELTACRYGLDMAVEELDMLANKYGSMPRYYEALAKLNMIFNAYEVAYEAIKRGLEFDGEHKELLRMKLETEKILFLDTTETLKVFAVREYLSEDELLDALSTLFEFEEYELAEKLTRNADFRDKQRVLMVRACVLYNLYGDNSETRRIFKRLNLMFRDLSPAKRYFINGEIVEPLGGKYDVRDAFNAHRCAMLRAVRVFGECLNAADGSIDILTDDIKDMLSLVMYGTELDEEAVHLIVRDKFSDKVFIDNEEFFKDLLIAGDISDRVNEASLYRLLSIDAFGRYFATYGDYVYRAEPIVNDMVMALPEALKKAYFYAAAVMSFSFKFDEYALYDVLLRLVNSGAFDENRHTDYKAVAAALAKCSYSEMFDYDLDRLAKLFDTRKSRITAVKRDWNKGKNFFSTKDMENFMMTRLNKMVEGFKSNFGL